MIDELGVLTFSNSEGNFDGELTNARNPSKSSLTVLGDKMSECASMISVRPRFFPGSNNQSCPSINCDYFTSFRRRFISELEAWWQWRRMFKWIKNILLLKTCNTFGKLRFTVDFICSQSIEGAAHPPICGVGFENHRTVNLSIQFFNLIILELNSYINSFPFTSLYGRLLVPVGRRPVLNIKTWVHRMPENLKQSRIAVFHVHTFKNLLEFKGQVLQRFFL